MSFKPFLFLISLNLFQSVAYANLEDCRNKTVVELKDDVIMEFCEIPAAKSVLIGSENGNPNEKPLLARDFQKFQIGQYEVTQLQFNTFLLSKPWKNKPNTHVGDNYPASYVSHTDAVQYANILSNIDPSADYRLPTEAEWEYAARAGTNTDYYWGNNASPMYAYFSSNLERKVVGPSLVTTCPSEFLNARQPGYCANAFGLMHMLGNVSEMTSDVYVNNYNHALVDGHDPVVARSPLRVLRGGSSNSMADSLRCAHRAFVDRRKHLNNGFRLVRIPK